MIFDFLASLLSRPKCLPEASFGSRKDLLSVGCCHSFLTKCKRI